MADSTTTPRMYCSALIRLDLPLALAPYITALRKRRGAALSPEQAPLNRLHHYAAGFAAA